MTIKKSPAIVLFSLLMSLVITLNGAPEPTVSPNAKHVYWLIESSVKEGQLENLKAMNAEMVKATKANEPGTLSYDWSISDDGKTCYIFERYTSSEAVMVHLKTLGEKFAERLMATIEIKSVQVFGNPNDEVKKALGALGAKFHQSIGGYTK